MNRRNFLRASSAACLATGYSISSALAKPRYQGCCQHPSAIHRILNDTRVHIHGFSSNAPLIPASGDAEFDRALGRQLVRLAKDFSVRPGFAYVNDSDGYNAMATSVTRIRGTQGTVLFGAGLMRKFLDQGVGGDISVLGVCAHEFAHIHQFTSGDYAELASQHETSKLIELQADFLSGFFLGTVKSERPSINLQKYGAFLYEAGSYDFTHPDFHGTPAQRVEAAEQGFRMAQAESSFRSASVKGKAYVIANFS